MKTFNPAETMVIANGISAIISLKGFMPDFFATVMDKLAGENGLIVIDEMLVVDDISLCGEGWDGLGIDDYEAAVNFSFGSVKLTYAENTLRNPDAIDFQLSIDNHQELGINNCSLSGSFPRERCPKPVFEPDLEIKRIENKPF